MKFKKDANGEHIWTHKVYVDRHGREEHDYAREVEEDG